MENVTVSPENYSIHRVRKTVLLQDEPVERQIGSNIVVAYAGTINGEGYIRQLRSLAAILKQISGTLLLYGPLSESRADKIGLNGKNVILRGQVKSERLIHHLRKEADVLFVPMSFSPEDRVNMEMSFPSKLTDYTAVGVYQC